MELGMIGLGRMGGNMTQRLLNGGHSVVVYDPLKQARDDAVKRGAIGSDSVTELVQKLKLPRTIWLMVPSGDPIVAAVSELTAELGRDDILIDGGNSNYRDSQRRAATLVKKGILFLDVGTSGGIWGLKEGYCLMVGGDKDAFSRVEPLFRTLAPSPSQGYGYVGPSGAGHYTKMVHNAIEYALMEAYAEGFELMQAKTEFKLNLPQVAEIWRYGSVVRSWLLDLIAAALKEDPRLDKIQAYVEDSGEGRWAVIESIELGIPIPAIALALEARFRSRQSQPFGTKLLAALRQQFGGHTVRENEP